LGLFSSLSISVLDSYSNPPFLPRILHCISTDIFLFKSQHLHQLILYI
jgi:hypothetical protein